jgi:hypothetical protein
MGTTVKERHWTKRKKHINKEGFIRTLLPPKKERNGDRIWGRETQQRKGGSKLKGPADFAAKPRKELGIRIKS